MGPEVTNEVDNGQNLQDQGLNVGGETVPETPAGGGANDDLNAAEGTGGVQ